ncbi:MAG: coniferyl aldehyde dehydrogenase [Pseudomonadota bacterium]
MAPYSSRPIPESTGASESNKKVDALHGLFQRQRQAYQSEPYPTYEQRTAWLNALEAMLDRNEDRLIAAVTEDFGARGTVENLVAEIVMPIGAAKSARKSLRRWMKPKSVSTPLYLLPGKSRLEPQPLGVVGIISPWNYPVQLALVPAAAALAAGNRVLIKPSELSPHTSAVMREIVADAFDETVMSVATGGVELGQAFSTLPFDHLLFTGSTAVGQKVYEAAAKNLTPVTLELGGKSPAIIDKSADLARAAKSIAYGNGFNAGQTCIAPDYVLTPEPLLRQTAAAIADAARALYPEIDKTPDYTAIISDRHFARLKSMVEEAKASGAEVIEVGSANALHPQRKLPFTIVVDPKPDLGLMQEEIFGPILPILPIPSLDAAISHVNKGERPLAFYWFGEDSKKRDFVLKQTTAGGVTINDTLVHYSQERLPFGGVGKSGIGAYHGDAGFETFSHMKPVFQQSRFASSGGLFPPYTDKTTKLISILRKII